MILSLAEVKSAVSIAKNGTFSAHVDKDNAVRSVVYTSPFRTGDEGGFVGLPNKGQKIICCKTGSRDPWYYLATAFSPPEGSGDGSPVRDIKSPLESVDHRMYEARGLPMRTVWGSNAGHKIILSDEYNPNFFNKRLELRSGVGKRLKFLDSPEQDCILLMNEHRDGIKISSEPDRTSAAQSIEVESRGPQKYINRESQTDIWVIEGRELNIINNSTGLFDNGLDPGKYGNINIESAQRDINIQGKSPSSRIFLQTLANGQSLGADVAPDQPQVIQLRTMGNNKGPDLETRIIVHSTGKVEIHSTNNLVIESEKDITMAAGGTINMNAPGGVNIDAGLTGLVNINSGLAAGIVPNTVNPAINHYEGNGVY